MSCLMGSSCQVCGRDGFDPLDLVMDFDTDILHCPYCLGTNDVFIPVPPVRIKTTYRTMPSRRYSARESKEKKSKPYVRPLVPV